MVIKGSEVCFGACKHQLPFCKRAQNVSVGKGRVLSFNCNANLSTVYDTILDSAAWELWFLHVFFIGVKNALQISAFLHKAKQMGR